MDLRPCCSSESTTRIRAWFRHRVAMPTATATPTIFAEPFTPSNLTAFRRTISFSVRQRFPHRNRQLFCCSRPVSWDLRHSGSAGPALKPSSFFPQEIHEHTGPAKAGLDVFLRQIFRKRGLLLGSEFFHQRFVIRPVVQ